MLFSKHKPPEQDPTSIGNILILMGLINSFELADIVDAFRQSKDELLGQFIVRKTSLTEDQLDLALIRQRIMRGQADQESLDRLVELSSKSDQRIASHIDDLTRMAYSVKRN